MIHSILIAIHAAAAGAALLAGLAAFRLPRLIPMHATTMLLMTIALAVAIWSGHTTTALPLELVFLGLLALAGYMSYRSIEAWRRRPVSGTRPGARCISALGFNCIGLITGLLAVSAFRLGWAIPAIIAVSVMPTLVGRLLVNRALRAADRTTTPDAHDLTRP